VGKTSKTFDIRSVERRKRSLFCDIIANGTTALFCDTIVTGTANIIFRIEGCKFFSIQVHGPQVKDD
jgi:hypothetical protein